MRDLSSAAKFRALFFDLNFAGSVQMPDGWLAVNSTNIDVLNGTSAYFSPVSCPLVKAGVICRRQPVLTNKAEELVSQLTVAGNRAYVLSSLECGRLRLLFSADPTRFEIAMGGVVQANRRPAVSVYGWYLGKDGERGDEVTAVLISANESAHLITLFLQAPVHLFWRYEPMFRELINSFTWREVYPV